MVPGEVCTERSERGTRAERRLCETLNACKEKNVKEILACVREDVAAHVGEAEQSDDITMLGVRFLGA